MSQKIRVLIVDGDDANIFMLQEILEFEKLYDYEIVTREGNIFEAISQFHPDIVLLDMETPGIDGYTICRNIKGENNSKFIKVMMLSGKASISDRLKGYKSGADDYIIKPFDEDELLAKIKVFANLKNAEEIDQIKTDLLMLLAHETRTPLNGIFMGVQALSDSRLTERQSENLRIISDSANRLLDFTGKVFLLSELKSGVRKISRDIFFISAHMKNVIEAMQKPIREKNVSFVFHGSDCGIIRGDQSLIYTLIQYLFENAIKFSPQNGIVTITQEEQNGRCRVRIQDQGIGIPGKWIEKIFDEFAIKDIMHHQKGLGLSLAISRYIMRLHDGAITASNAPDGGAIFTLELPISN